MNLFTKIIACCMLLLLVAASPAHSQQRNQNTIAEFFSTPAQAVETRTTSNSNLSEFANPTGNADYATAEEAPVAAFNAIRTTLCAGSRIELRDQSTNNPTSWTWTLFDSNGNSVASTSARNTSLVFNAPNTYVLELSVSNEFGSSTAREALAVLSNSNGANIRFDFNDTDGVDDDPDITPSGWLLWNPDSNRTFEAKPFGSAYELEGGYLRFNNWTLADGSPRGEEDILISSKIALSSLTDPYLTFDYSYALRSATISDTLAIYYSTDCGESMVELKRYAGSDLATAPSTGFFYFPQKVDDWRSDAISLAFLEGADVHFYFKNISSRFGAGQLLYLDNIHFWNTTLPEADFSIAKTQVCVGETVTFEDQSANFPNRFYWEFEGGNMAVDSVQNPQIQYDTPGTYNVQLISENIFGRDTVEKTIEVLAVPDVSVELAGATCLGETVSLTATGADTYEWFNSADESLSTEAVLTFEVVATAQYKVVGTNEVGCTTEVTETIRVAPKPEVSVEMVSAVCEGDSVSLTATGAETYLWLNEAGDSLSMEAVLAVEAIAAEMFTVIGTSEAGCTNEATQAIEVIPGPDVQIEADQVELCAGDTVELVASGAQRYLWFIENFDTPVFEDEVFDFPVSESQTVTLIGINELGCEKETSVALSVFPFPETPDIAITGDTLAAIVVDTMANYQYQWYVNDTAIPADSGGQALAYVITQSGSYRLEIINNGGCSTSSPSYDVILTSIERPDVSELVSVYPNPTQDQVRIQLPSAYLGSWNLKVHNAIGQEISSFSKELRQRETTLDLSALPRGAYFFFITNDEARAVKKVVKQ